MSKPPPGPLPGPPLRPPPGPPPGYLPGQRPGPVDGNEDGGAGQAIAGAVRGAGDGGRSRDPLAVALANASLLSAGYLLLGRRGPVLRQRVIALAVLLPMLLVAGLLRLDASRTEGKVAAARRSGDCAQALSAQDGLWFGPRVADAPLTASGDRTVRACHRLGVAQHELTTGLSGDTHALTAGFDGLAAVLADLPGHEKMVDTVLNGFLGRLPTKVPCDTVTVTDWLRQHRPGHGYLGRAAAVVPKTAPAALVGCGDDLMEAKEWAKARDRYQQQLDQYPGDRLAAKARSGVKQATLTIELDNVRTLLGTSTDTEPDYCSKPAKYSAAAPYRKGTHHALFYGDDEYTRELPGSWSADDVTKAVLVVCVGDKDYGTTVTTCPYENKLLPDFPREVKFRKIAIPVKVFELRTGKLVSSRTVQIGGGSCPGSLSYTTYGTIDTGPPSEVYVTPSTSDIRSAFRPLRCTRTGRGIARECVAALPMDTGRDPDDPEVAALIGELSLREVDFWIWWASHQVRGSRQPGGRRDDEPADRA
ncbi:hypothetical protein ACFZAM_18330 [Streptomyces sp. NPDC008079]|uniref:MmyB family transcriptional regulator n=1 Tax=Streptomyces sp. NPDC008079 TaxID=3364806 RepID=UPI0036EA5163